MKLKTLLNNEWENGEIILTDNLYAYIERLEYVDNEEDILIELFHHDYDNFLCNCLSIKGHNFKSDNNIGEVKKYLFSCIRKLKAKYKKFVKTWRKDHSNPAFKGMEPPCFEEWLDFDSGLGLH